jgi:peptidoglycan/xylan/chitin deacetylase (PgdA/CDA1 family)
MRGARRAGTPIACGLVFALALALLSSSPAQSQDPDAKASPAMCWAPEQLGFRPGEQRIRKGVTGAFVSPPKRSPLPAVEAPRNRGEAIRRVKLPPGKKLVAMTFDLCEQPNEIAGYQGGTVDFLRANGIKATFFAGGKWLLTHRDRAKQLMSDPLFEMGNHTWEHRNLRLLSGDALHKEVENAQIAYEQVRDELERAQCLAPDGSGPAHATAQKRLGLFRFPFGACSDKALDKVGELGLTAIQWDVSSGDPTPTLGAEAMARGVLASVKPGSIILFHANGRGWSTPEALPHIVAELKKRGYGFVTVSELLAAGEPVAEPRCYDSRPGDTDRYDGLAQRLELMYRHARAKALSAAAPFRAQSPPESVPAPRPAQRPAGPPKPKTDVPSDPGR